MRLCVRVREREREVSWLGVDFVGEWWRGERRAALSASLVEVDFIICN